MARSSAQREHPTEEAGSSPINREMLRAKKGSSRNTLTNSKRTNFEIFIDHASAPIRKERLSPKSKAKREANQNELMKKGGMPDRVKSSRETIVERIVREPYTGLSNPFKMDRDRNRTRSRADRLEQKPAQWGERMDLFYYRAGTFPMNCFQECKHRTFNNANKFKSQLYFC